MSIDRHKIVASVTGKSTTTSTATTMKAITQTRYGSAHDVLRLADIPRPVVGAGEVLVRVAAAGLDRGVWHLMTGLPYPVRLAGYGLRAPKSGVLGSDLAGRVEAVGTGVRTLQPGDDVVGIGEGAFAEYARCNADQLVRKPAAITFERAAALPVSATTALQALRDQAHVRAGQKVLVIGASGGVGSFAVQLAKIFGADVTGVCSTDKVDLVHTLGADHVIDYSRADFAEGPQRCDVILDTGGQSSLRRLRRALTPRGTLVIVGAETGGRILGGTDRQLRAMALSVFVGQSLRSFIASPNQADLATLIELVAEGRLSPAVDRAFALGEVPAAIDYLTEGHARGKVVIRVAESLE